jgi:hypothetical protein
MITFNLTPADFDAVLSDQEAVRRNPYLRKGDSLSASHRKKSTDSLSSATLKKKSASCD